ncbi:hypothetical protein, partial [Endozoicomonas numazuensis]|uniref:hypothetical protein n=1 Tax=Endozoicomonas numazuensis TaxID=1137799 RepID=UPI000551B768
SGLPIKNQPPVSLNAVPDPGGEESPLKRIALTEPSAPHQVKSLAIRSVTNITSFHRSLHQSILAKDVESIRRQLIPLPVEFRAQLGERKYLHEEERGKYNLEADKSFSPLTLARIYGNDEIVALIKAQMPGREYYLKLAQDIIREDRPDLIGVIDQGSWDNMADALKFAGINSLETARDMSLKVCPPVAQFYTWTALNGTTIFNGVNNTKYNYVERISQQAEQMALFGLPVLVVFSESDMSSEQIQEMQRVFIKHPNIVTLSLESNLGFDMASGMGKWYQGKIGLSARDSLLYMDCLRLCVAHHVEKTLDTALSCAKSQDKKELAKRLEMVGKSGIFFSDVDNGWLQRPSYMLASDGCFTQPAYSILCSKIVNSKHCAESEGKIVEELNVLNQELRRGCGYPLSWQEPMVRARQHCYDYLVTGKAEDDYYHLVRKYDS